MENRNDNLESTRSSSKSAPHEFIDSPWMFKDSELELGYQKDSIENMLDRSLHLKKIIMYVFFALWGAFFVSRALAFQPFSRSELTSFLPLVLSLAFFSIVAFVEWSDDMKRRAGIGVFWVSRLLNLVVLSSEAGIPQVPA